MRTVTTWLLIWLLAFSPLFAAGQGNNQNNLPQGGVTHFPGAPTGGAGQCLPFQTAVNDATQAFFFCAAGGTWTAIAAAAGATGFNSVLAGTNTNALVEGTGGSITRSGTGIVDANQVNSATVPVSKTIVGTNLSGQIVDASSAAITNNTSGSAGSLNGISLLPNGMTAQTQAGGDTSQKVATDAFVLANQGSGPAASQGQHIVNSNGVTTYVGTSASFDVSVFTGADPCAKIDTAAAAVGISNPTIYDVGGLTGTFTCTPTNTNNTYRNVGEGSVILLGNITLKLGTVQRNSANTGCVASGPAEDCFGAWILPKNVRIRGISPAASIIQVDASGCSGKPTVSCTNWVQRFATIVSAALSGSGPQCTANASNNCWVTLTVSGMTGGITPQTGELFQVQSTTTGTADSNWGMYPVNAAPNNPGNNGGAPCTPSTTTLCFYTDTPLATTNGGTVFLSTCLICFGFDGTSGGENGTPYSQGNSVENVALNCVSVAGCVGLENVAAQENTGYWNLTVKNFDFAGIAMWNVASGGSSFSNSGPYGPTFLLECQGLASCAGAHNYASVLMYLGNNHTRGYIGAGTMVGGATGDSGFYGFDPNGNQKPQCGLMIEGDHQNSLIEGFHIEQGQNAVCVGYHMASVGVHLASFQGHSSIAGAVINVSKNFQYASQSGNSKGQQTSDFLFTEIGSNGAVGATLIDNINGFTSFDLNLSMYAFDASPGPASLITSAAFQSTFGPGITAGPWRGASAGSNPPFCYLSTAGGMCNNEGNDPPGFLSGIGFLWPNGVEHRYVWNSNNGIRQGLPQMVMLTSQYANSTTGFTNVTGGNNMAWPVAASQNYSISCTLQYQGAATAGLNIEFTGPAGPTALSYSLNAPLSATAINAGSNPASGTSVGAAYGVSLGAAVTTATTNFPATISFGLVNGTTAGTVQLLAKSSAAAQLQIQAGSFCVMQ